MKIGIDLGISATKIVALEGEQPIQKVLIDHPVTPDELEKWLVENGLAEGNTLAVTGVGSKNIGGLLAGMPVTHADEFEANACASRWYCQEDRFIVVSMGSGTSFVLIDGGTSTHIGGSALGGATLNGLLSLLLPGTDYTQFRALAEKGKLSRIDLQIGDVSKVALPHLPLDTTASNLGKAGKDSSPEDIAAGLVNLILQNIGVMANLAGSGRGITTFLMIGRMTTLPQSREIFDRLEALYGIRLMVPKMAVYMTAFGAA